MPSGSSSYSLLHQHAEAVVGMLAAFSGVSEVPARPWPLASACQVLATLISPGSPSFTAASQCGSSLTAAHVVERWLVELASTGAASTCGAGSGAVWRFDPTW